MTCVKTVAIILFDGVNALDVTGPLEAFAAVQNDDGSPAYCVTTWSADDLTVSAESGLQFLAHAQLPEAASADLLLIPGGAGLRQPDRLKRIAAWLNHQQAHFTRIASVCTGAFALAESGLCDNRRLVTHWRFTGQLRRQYPQVQVQADALFMNDGKFYSSGGITSGIDLALSLIEADFGARASMAAARELVVFLRRSGSQTQFSEPLKLQTGAPDALAEACLWASNHLSDTISVDDLAARAALGPRQFSRRFRQSFGTSPAHYINTLRLDSARSALEKAGASLERVAFGSGFKSVDGFRRAFERHFHITPGEYQRRFQS